MSWECRELKEDEWGIGLSLECKELQDELGV